MKGKLGLTVKGARKVLGVSALDVSDEQIEQDIETAVLLKDLFFEKLRESNKKSGVELPNVP